MDIIAYTLSDAAVTINLSHVGDDDQTATPAKGGDADGDMIMADVEGVRGSDHADMLVGNDVGKVVPTGETDDPGTTDVDESQNMTDPGPGNMLFGNMGDDMLEGLGGMDSLRGGEGVRHVQAVQMRL